MPPCKCDCPALAGDQCHMGDGCRALEKVKRQSQQVEPTADTPWKDAVIDQLVVSHILTAEHETNPRKAVLDLLSLESDIAIDPRVSEAAAKLVEQARAEEREACAKVIENTSSFSSSPKAVFFISPEARREQAAAIRARGEK